MIEWCYLKIHVREHSKKCISKFKQLNLSGGACRRFDHKMATLCVEKKGGKAMQKCSIPRMSPVLFELPARLHSYRRWQSRLAATKLGSRERLRLEAVEREPTADLPTALSASCPGTFPWAGEEKPSSLLVAQIASRPNAPDVLAASRVYVGRLVGLGLYDGPTLKTIHECGVKFFGKLFSKCQSGTFLLCRSSLLRLRAHTNAATPQLNGSPPQRIMGKFKGTIAK